jgi:hypothetical protein
LLSVCLTAYLTVCLRQDDSEDQQPGPRSYRKGAYLGPSKSARLRAAEAAEEEEAAAEEQLAAALLMEGGVPDEWLYGLHCVACGYVGEMMMCEVGGWVCRGDDG